MKRIIAATLLGALALNAFNASADGHKSSCWNPDRGREYVNPIIHADYSDPDVCRVGDDYYMTSSSFGCFPGLQILHSTDLVNWEIIGAALHDYPGASWSDERPWEITGHGVRCDLPAPPGHMDWRTRPQHGKGVWAPAIRHHDGEFYIFCGDPDRGVFMVKTKDPAGVWEAPVWVMKAQGVIDPCPLWDEDGKAYLSFGCAGSRAGNKSIMMVAPMSEDGTRLTGPGQIVYDGHRTQPTIEGTKFYKFRSHYYIFSPAGGVPTGWQVVFKSDSPFGPYQERVVMAQGSSPVNGPHQGAWVDTPSGEHWFLHFQDKGAYGRIIHLQPMSWTGEDWPVIGIDKDGDGVGEPVMRYRKPDLKHSGTFQPAESDGFDQVGLGLQWQWNGIPSIYWSFVDTSDEDGVLRLYSVEQSEQWKNLYDSPNLLLQKFPAENFTVTASIRFIPNPQLEDRGETCGLVIMGLDYAALRLRDSDKGVVLEVVECKNAEGGEAEKVIDCISLESTALPTPYSDRYMSTTVPPVAPLAYRQTEVSLRVKVSSKERKGNFPDAVCTFQYSLDGMKWRDIKDGTWSFTASAGKWIGAKFGFWCNRYAPKNDSGFVEIKQVTVE